MILIIPLTARCEKCNEHLSASQLPFEAIPDHITLEIVCPNGCHAKQVTIDLEKTLGEAGAYTMKGGRNNVR